MRSTAPRGNGAGHARSREGDPAAEVAIESSARLRFDDRQAMSARSIAAASPTAADRDLMRGETPDEETGRRLLVGVRSERHGRAGSSVAR